MRSPQEPLRSWFGKGGLTFQFHWCEATGWWAQQQLIPGASGRATALLARFHRTGVSKVASICFRKVCIFWAPLPSPPRSRSPNHLWALQRQEQLEGATGSRALEPSGLGIATPGSGADVQARTARQTRLRPKTAQVTLLGRPRGTSCGLELKTPGWQRLPTEEPCAKAKETGCRCR